MSNRTTPPGIVLVLVAAAAAGIAAYLRRPVKPPADSGTWHPAETQTTRRK